MFWGSLLSKNMHTHWIMFFFFDSWGRYVASLLLAYFVLIFEYAPVKMTKVVVAARSTPEEPRKRAKPSKPLPPSRVASHSTPEEPRKNAKPSIRIQKVIFLIIRFVMEGQIRFKKVVIGKILPFYLLLCVEPFTIDCILGDDNEINDKTLDEIIDIVVTKSPFSIHLYETGLLLTLHHHIHQLLIYFYFVSHKILKRLDVSREGLYKWQRPSSWPNLLLMVFHICAIIVIWYTNSK